MHATYDWAHRMSAAVSGLTAVYLAKLGRIREPVVARWGGRGEQLYLKTNRKHVQSPVFMLETPLHLRCLLYCDCVKHAYAA